MTTTETEPKTVEDALEVGIKVRRTKNTRQIERAHKQLADDLESGKAPAEAIEAAMAIFTAYPDRADQALDAALGALNTVEKKIPHEKSDSHDSGAPPDDKSVERHAKRRSTRVMFWIFTAIAVLTVVLVMKYGTRNLLAENGLGGWVAIPIGFFAIVCVMRFMDRTYKQWLLLALAGTIPMFAIVFVMVYLRIGPHWADFVLGDDGQRAWMQVPLFFLWMVLPLMLLASVWSNPDREVVEATKPRDRRAERTKRLEEDHRPTALKFTQWVERRLDAFMGRLVHYRAQVASALPQSGSGEIRRVFWVVFVSVLVGLMLGLETGWAFNECASTVNGC